MYRRHLVAITCCWIVGSGLSYMYNGWVFWLILVGMSLMFPLVSVLTRLPFRMVVLWWVCLCLAALYWTYTDSRNTSLITTILQQHAAQIDESITTFEGRIISAVEIDGDRADFTIKLISMSADTNVYGEKVAAQVRLASEAELAIAQQWRRGEQVTIEGTLVQPGTARNFESFDYRAYLHREQIHWLLKANGASSVNASPGDLNGSVLLSWNDNVRARLGSCLEELFETRSAGYMKGLLIGWIDDLDPATYAQFSQLGLTHILAISGSHVAINVSIVFGILRLLRVTREKSYTIVLLFVPLYVLITGFSPSVIRSGMMTMIGVYVIRKGLLKDSLNILAAAALMMLLWNPYFLLNVSFQLSFAVTAGLIIFVPLLQPFFAFLPRKIAGVVAITVAAQITSFPVTIYYFNQLSLLSLAANLIIVPVIGLVSLPLGTAALLLGMVWLPLGRGIAYPTEFINNVTFTVIEWLNARSGFMTIWKSPTLGWIGAFYVMIYLLLIVEQWRRRQLQPPQDFGEDTVPLFPELLEDRVPISQLRQIRVLRWTQYVLGLILVVQLHNGYQSVYTKGVGYVEFIDVGQGDSILITTPEGRHILVDGGGTVSFRKPGDAWRDRKQPFEVGAKVVVPLLKKRGIHRLDAVIMTHGDQDHIGGLRAVLDNIPVDAILMNGKVGKSQTLIQLLSSAMSQQVPVYSVSQGMVLSPDNSTQIQFISPFPTGGPDTPLPYVDDQNHESIMFLLDMKGSRFLLTGDMDKAGELEVLEQLKSTSDSSTEQVNLSPVDVLKVSHHGSKTSTSEEWLDIWQPHTAVISVGGSNSYGHPHPIVMERLADYGVQVFRTDLVGEIQMLVRKDGILMRSKLTQ